jgi:hypothetical protein
MMKLLTPIAVSLVLLASTAANAQTSLSCIKFPFQTSAHLAVASSLDTQHLSFPLVLPNTPVEIEQVTIHVVGNQTGVLNLLALNATTVLAGHSVRHGFELGGVITASSDFGRDLLRLVKLYADPGSTIAFGADAYIGSGSGQIDVTLVGRLVTPGCWIGPQ